MSGFLPAWALYPLAAAAVYRLARLVACDDGLFNVFLRLRTRANPDSNWGRLIVCPYCLGVWFAGAVALAAIFRSAVGDAAILMLGLAGAQTWMERR